MRTEALRRDIIGVVFIAFPVFVIGLWVMSINPVASAAASAPIMTTSSTHLQMQSVAHAYSSSSLDCMPNWSVVASPDVGNNSFLNWGIAVVSSNDVWAVGSYSNGVADQTLTEHWDGSAWSVIPSPNTGTSNNSLSGASAIASNDVWAVGQYVSDEGAWQTLMEHWDGNMWSIVPSPNVTARDHNFYRATATSHNDVWAVGFYLNDLGAWQTLTEHWDGNSWRVVPSPNVLRDNFLIGLAAISSSDVWAVGYSEGPTVQTLIEHWDGNSWSVVPSPNVGNQLNAVSAISSSDVWAVGYDSRSSTVQTLIEHWDGNSWSVVPSPNKGSYNNFLVGVSEVSNSSVSAVGFYFNGSLYQTLAEHWDGNSWSVVPSPIVGLGDNLFNEVAMVSSSDGWAVGYYSNNHALIARYNPGVACTSTPTATATSTQTSTPTHTATDTSTATSTPTTACAPLGPAADFNLFVLGNLNASNSTTEGRAAAGGNITLTNYRVGTLLTNSNGTRDDLIGGANITFANGQVANGNAVYRGIGTFANVSFPHGSARRASVLDFNVAGQYLRSASSTWGALQTNGTVSWQSNQYILTGTNPHLNVFNISSVNLARANILTINAPVGSTVLVNINGTNVTAANVTTVINGTTRERVLYNFPQASSISFINVAIQGSILAPRSTLNWANGQVNGNLILATLNATVEVNYHIFNGCLPGF